MVEEQMAQAMEMATKMADGVVPAPSPKARVPSGGRVMVAMMNAGGNNCACTPCRLLRAESAQMSELALAELEDNGGSTDHQPG